MEEMLEKLQPISEECSIYRVSKRLHNINDMAYTPQAISIGPLHHGRQELMAMEQYKLLFLKSYLSRVGMKIADALEIARGWETRARKFYAEPIDMDSDDFVKMMLVDGCFLVEFFRKIFGFDSSMTCILRRDLLHDFMMLENQLPFFIIEFLDDEYDWRVLVPLVLLADMLSMDYIYQLTDRFNVGAHLRDREVCHFLDIRSFDFMLFPTKTGNNEEPKDKKVMGHPPTATELWEAGVKFQKATGREHLLEIQFGNGVLKIPPISIHDGFETYVRNLLVFENYHRKADERHVNEYVSFMDYLISTEKDVSLLSKKGIIGNHIGGDDKDICKLFNDLCKYMDYPSESSYYAEMNFKLREYCDRPWHRWKASLKRNYFNTPWAFISFLAASFLILLTLMQAVYSALSYHK